MKKKVLTISNLILSSLITLLGFGACKTQKNMDKENQMQINEDDIRKKEPIINDSITPIRRRPGGEIRVLYGAPPTERIVISKEME